MPLHEYECRTCAVRFEQLYRKPGDVPDTGDVTCPRCGNAVRRLVGAASLAGRADVGIGRAAWPRSWADTQRGDPEVLRNWRQRIEREMRQEEKNPELAHLRHANATRQYERKHGPGSVQAGAAQSTGHAHAHAWTAVPFVTPTRYKS